MMLKTSSRISFLCMSSDDVGDFMMGFEIFFTVVFSIEYLLRVVCVRRPAEFIFSLFGFIDICALVPSYLGMLMRIMMRRSY